MHLSIRLAAISIVLAICCTSCKDKEEQAMTDQKNKRSPDFLVGHADDESSLPEGVKLHKSREPDAPDRVSRIPTVSDAPKAINQTKVTYEKAIDEDYANTLKALKEGQWFFLDDDTCLKARPEQAIIDLKALIDDESLPAKKRCQAAETLHRVDPKTASRCLFTLLAEDATELKIAALDSLGDWYVKPDFSSLENREKVFALLKHPSEQVVIEAAKLCAYRKIPGSESQLLALLEKGALKEPGAIGKELIRIATTPQSVKLALPHVLVDVDRFEDSDTYWLERLIDDGSPELASLIKRPLYDYAIQFKQNRYDQHCVNVIAKSAQADAIPVLEDICKNAKDRTSQMYAVEALARLQPDQAVSILLAYIEREGLGYNVRMLNDHVKETDFIRVKKVIAKLLDKSSKPIHESIVSLFLDKFSEQGKQFIKARIDKLDPDAKMLATWKLNDISLKSAIADLHQTGIIQSPLEDVIKGLEVSLKNQDIPGGLDLGDPRLLTNVLIDEKIMTMFDAETGMIPCSHDKLILQLAEISNNQFKPQWPIQSWHQTNEEDYNAPYTLQFVFKERLYQSGIENYGDWYDVQAVLDLLNFALEQNNLPERYITLESDGQVVSVLYANPKTFLPIADKYQIPVNADASQAMRKGIAFEQHVIESYEK